MGEVLDTALTRVRESAELLAGDAVAVDPLWLVLGVLVHVAAQVVRIRGWWTILRAAYPERARELRHRDVAAAYLAGAGLNGLLPARAGDIVKYAALHRRIPGSRYATLAATSVPETLFESACGAALVVWMVTRGFVPVPVGPGDLPQLDVSTAAQHPVAAALVVVAVAAPAAGLLAVARRRARPLLARLRQGLAVLGRPETYVSGVVTWQALGRVIRLASLACFLRAFGLPATPAAALLVMAAQSGGRIVPVAPVSAGLRIAMLSYGLVEVTGRAVDPGAIVVFTVGASACLFVTMLSISLVLAARELGARTPAAALRAARGRLARRALPGVPSAALSPARQRSQPEGATGQS
jgi:hypothetical protein